MLTVNLSENLGKYLLMTILDNTYFGKVADSQPAICQKNELYYKYISSNLSTSKYTSKKKASFWNWMYIMLLKAYCSFFSAVAVCMFDWLMVSLLRTHRRMVWLTAFAFECDR